MRRANLLAATLIVAVFATLAALPLGRPALPGDPTLSRTLVEMGLRQEDMPLGGIGPALPVVPSVAESQPAPGDELEVRLVNALALSNPQKWAAIKKLVADFPEKPEAHAALARLSCKYAGSVGVGREDEQAKLATASRFATHAMRPSDAGDIAALLASCAAGERLEPGNAFFPAMAAVGHYAAHDDEKARAALARAAHQPTWNEHLDAEKRGLELHAARLGRSPGVLARSIRLASILFPHYAQLRGVARLATVQAMEKEKRGDVAGGLELRRDVARLGETMRIEGESFITALVGQALVGVATARPGGAPAINEGPDTDDSGDAPKVTAFLAWVESHDKPGERAVWAQALETRKTLSAIGDVGRERSALGFPSMLETTVRSAASLALIGSVATVCLLGALGYLTPLFGRRFGKTAVAATLLGGLGGLLWLGWLGLGTLRDSLAYADLLRGLSGHGEGSIDNGLPGFVVREAMLGGLALLAPLLWLFFVAVLGNRPSKPSRPALLRRGALPLAAVLALVYGAHAVAFGLRERSVQTELDALSRHEGRYLAQKAGREWPGRMLQ